MEKEKATKVGCQACKKNPQVKTVVNTVFIAGGIVVSLAIWGLISLVKFLIGLF